jgi:hypothetical protein
MDIKKIVDALVFEPDYRIPKCGNEIQVCHTTYKGMKIYQETFFPHNFLKKPTDTFFLDLCLPMTTIVPNGEMCSYGYFEEGYGKPIFKEIEYAIEFIDNIKPNG